MLSIYTSGFNLIKHKFNYEEALANFCQFADEVVIAINTSEDDTLSKVKELSDKYKNLIVVDTDFSYTDPGMDGKIKNAALQTCSNDIVIQLDLDERILQTQKREWVRYASQLKYSEAIALMIPVLNLYKDVDHIKDIGTKWYLHKRFGTYRGVVKFARLDNGCHETDKSDSCELIDHNGHLVQTLYLLHPMMDIDQKLKLIKEHSLPYVIHYGYLDLDKRVELNKNFWKKHWSIEAGKDINIPTETAELEGFNYVKHELEVQ